jgi:hypothetical protein
MPHPQRIRHQARELTVKTPPTSFLGRHGHLDPETIVAFSNGILDASQKRMMEEHIADCPICSTALADFAEFEATESPEERIQGRMGAEQVLRIARRDRWKVLTAIAASILVVAGSVALWLARKPAAYADAPTFEVIVGNRAATAEIVLPAQASRFTLRLAGSGLEPGRRFDLRAFGSRGQVPAAIEAATVDSQGVLTLTLEAKPFPAGPYRLVLVRADSPSAIPIETSLRIVTGS